MKVELVAKTLPLVEGVSTAEFAAYVARIGKVKDNPEKLMKYLLDHKHFSPFEHTSFTFKIRTSRAIGRELLRHRSFTFQELSQRYEKVLEFEDVELRKQAEKNRQSSEEVINPRVTYEEPDGEVTNEANSAVMDVISTIKSLYVSLLEAGIARECARMILPECIATTILMTGTLRSWIHFLDIRDEGAAQKEMQLIAREIKKSLAEEVPGMFGEVKKES